MDYVIDLQGFRDASNQFIVKEAAVLALHSNHIGNWFATPPFPFTDLPVDIRTTNNHLTCNHHGVEWFDGDIPQKQIYAKLRDVARTARTIYTRGGEKTTLLQNVLSRRVTNLEDDNCPSFKKLPSSDTYCLYHAIHRQGVFVCALNQACQLKTWLSTKSVDEPDVYAQPIPYGSPLACSTPRDILSDDEQFATPECCKPDHCKNLWGLPC